MALEIDPDQYLESRLTESSFRRYEPLLAKAVAAFPGETSFTIPPDISPTTFVARFRDARFSFLKFGWSSTTVDREKLIAMQGKYTISLDSSTGLVWFRAKQRRGRPTEFVTQSFSSGVPQPTMRWSDYTPEELRAVCTLLSTRKLSGPIILTGHVQDDLAAELLTNFDVSLVHDESSNETTLM